MPRVHPPRPQQPLPHKNRWRNFLPKNHGAAPISNPSKPRQPRRLMLLEIMAMMATACTNPLPHPTKSQLPVGSESTLILTQTHATHPIQHRQHHKSTPILTGNRPARQPSNPLHPIPDQCQSSNPLPANPELEIQRESTPSNPQPMLTIKSAAGAVLPVPLSYALPAADAIRSPVAVDLVGAGLIKKL